MALIVGALVIGSLAAGGAVAAGGAASGAVLLYKKKRHGKKKKKALFGKALEELYKTHLNETLIPKVVDCVLDEVNKRGLEESGIFRKTGEVGQTEKIKHDYEKGNYDVDLSEYDIHAVVGVLAAFFMDLPDPLCTNRLYNRFLNIETDHKHSPDKWQEEIKEAFANLPERHARCFIKLLPFLYDVSTHSDVNQMTCANLAIVFGPLLFFQVIDEDDDEKSIDHDELVRQSMKDAEIINSLLEKMIENHSSILDKTIDELPSFDLENISEVEQVPPIPYRQSMSIEASSEPKEEDDQVVNGVPLKQPIIASVEQTSNTQPIKRVNTASKKWQHRAPERALPPPPPGKRPSSINEDLVIKEDVSQESSSESQPISASPIVAKRPPIECTIEVVPDTPPRRPKRFDKV